MEDDGEMEDHEDGIKRQLMTQSNAQMMRYERQSIPPVETICISSLVHDERLVANYQRHRMCIPFNGNG